MDIELVRLEKVYDDGRHNAFTDLCRWRGRTYLCFRSGADHYAPDGEVLVLASDDGEKWSTVCHVTGSDDHREPKLLATPDRLFLYVLARSAGDYHTRVCSTSDGAQWSALQTCSPSRQMFCKPFALGDRFYAPAYDRGPRDQLVAWGSLLLSSSDGIAWEKVSDVRVREGTNELYLMPHGDAIVGLLRRELAPGQTAALVRAAPPYATWEVMPTEVFVQGAALARVGHRWLVAGRCRNAGGDLVTGLLDLDLKRARLTCLLELPSGGDTGYAGLWQSGEGVLWVSYYSSHESWDGREKTRKRCPAAVFLARCAVKGA